MYKRQTLYRVKLIVRPDSYRHVLRNINYVDASLETLSVAVPHAQNRNLCFVYVTARVVYFLLPVV